MATATWKSKEIIALIIHTSYICKKSNNMTIAQQLNITTFPFEIKDDNGRKIYREDSYGYWEKAEYDQNGNQIYYENSNGRIMDNRPKPKPEPVQTAVGWLVEKYELVGMLTLPMIERANAMFEKQIINSNRDGVDMVMLEKNWISGKEYFHQTYGGDE
jgi:hypothetical protein